MADGPLPEKRIQQYLRTIEAIASARALERYVIGYTSQGSWKRFGQYRANGWNHLIVIAEGLPWHQAYHLEMELQRRAWQDERRTLFKKYDPSRREKKGFYGAPNHYMSEKKRTALTHLVYMAWRELPLGSPHPSNESGGEHTNTP
jgi:hypothetical protein